MKRPELTIETFGCKLNTYETEVMRVLSANQNLDDVTVINTCAVTSEAVRKARKSVRKSRRENPEKFIVVTGCAAQTEPETFAKMKEVDLVLGNKEKLSAITWKRLESYKSTKQYKKIQVDDIMKVSTLKSMPISALNGRSRAYVQIQNGCDHRCTFCIIPQGRGNSRSLPIQTVIDQVRKLETNGFQEIVLTGVDITSWGNDLIAKPTLGKLVKKILKSVPNLPRLRISSIDSIEVDSELMDVILNEDRLMPHLHLSLQSGDNLILKRMKRRHSRETAIEFCNKIQRYRPKIVFGADMIVGFPTETEPMFENSLQLVTDCNLTWLHVFPFSARAGTPAAKMPQVNHASIKLRAQRLRKQGNLQVKRYLDSIVGKNHAVLIEGNGKGRTETFAEVIVDCALKPGKIESIFVKAHNGKQLLAK